ncbi:MAG: secretin N-terminal domain-containing protein, partial [Planctomycetota bacterium]|nr:secretin N-terminal domain-containing protein [Planctomycetota bacterium]
MSTRKDRCEVLFRVTLSIFLLLLLGGGSPLTAQDAPKEEKTLNFNLGSASVKTVLDYISSETGYSVLVDEGITVEGKVTAVAKSPLTVSQALGFLNSFLIEKKVAAVLVGEVIRVVTLEKAQKINWNFGYGNDPDAIAITDKVMTWLIPLEFTSASDIKKELAGLISDTGRLDINVASNTLILSDTGTNIKRFLTVMASLDGRLSGKVQVRYFRLRYAAAEEASRLLGDLFQNSSGGAKSSGGSSGGRGGGRGGGPMSFWMQMMRQNQGGGGKGASSVPSQDVRVVADQRSNMVIVTASEKVLPLVEEIIAEIDKPTEETLVVRV